MTAPTERDPQAEQDHAEWLGWAEAQSYDESFDFNLEDMRDAFTSGMRAARDLDDATLAAEVRAGHVRIETDAPLPAPPTLGVTVNGEPVPRTSGNALPVSPELGAALAVIAEYERLADDLVIPNRAARDGIRERAGLTS